MAQEQQSATPPSQDPHLEQLKADRARRVGLSEEVPWGEIYAVEDQLERKTVASELGWEESIENTDEMIRLGLDPYPSWRNLLTDTLGIRRTASAEEIIEQIRSMSQGEQDKTQKD